MAEADAALPLVRAAVARAKAAMAGHATRLGTATALGERRSNGHAVGGGEAVEVVAAVADLDGLGIFLRDPGRGLVDFPAVAPSGRPYWLCWLDGEPSVGWWHWVEDGFAGRTRIDELPA
ncbi:MAG: DUF2203 family protein [Acidimicrobiia bacterium]|nr:DUF2203 family protein [Acidimicrobiia bacterium]